jgi:glycosyltransferase involved in cell wall biosynthesis
MHVIVVTGYYYPFLPPPGRCISPYIDNLALTHELEIICSVYDRRFSDDFINGNIRLNFVDGFSNKMKSYIHTNRALDKHPIKTSMVSWIYRAGRFLFSWFKKDAYEDSSMVKPMYDRLEKLHKDRSIDVVISVSFPFYSHVAAYKFKQKHPEVRWVTFTTDPFAYNEANPVADYKRRRAIALEQKIYDTCDYCISTEELYANLIDDFKIDSSKVLKLPFLLTTNPTDDNTPKTQERSKPVEILYAGYLYHKIRNPKLMMEVFCSLPDINFNMNVAGDRICRKYLAGQFPSHIKIRGLVSREKYLELLTVNDVFVNLSNTIRLQAPSKLLELVSTGKPIINFYHHEDSGYHIVEKYPLGINVSCKLSVKTIVEKLKLFIKENAKKRLSYTQICDYYPDYLFENQLPIVKKVITGDI